MYLIPKDYEGNLMIIFNQDKGLETTYEKQRRLYVFDTSGILKTKFSPTSGIQQNHYYYVDRLGNRTALKYALPSQLKGTNEVVILNQEPGKAYDTIKKLDEYFELFTVGKQFHIDSLANLRSEFMWKALN